METIRQFSPHDAEAYPRWNAFWERAASIVNPYRLRTPPTLAQLFDDVRGSAWYRQEVVGRLLEEALYRGERG